MEQVQEETVTNTPTPSRTIRITHNGDYTVSVNHGVTQADNGRRFLTFTTIDEAVTAFGELRAADIKSSYLTYALFVKSQAELTEESLKEEVLKLVADANVTYLRVDGNLHTGKVVVDVLADYQTIKSSSSDDLRFFHFDPKRVRPQGGRAQGGQRPQGGRAQGGQRAQGGRAQGGQRPQGGRAQGGQRAQGGRPQGGRGQQRPQGNNRNDV
jgi:hypothetical protein